MKGNIDTVELMKIDRGSSIYLLHDSWLGLVVYTYFPKEKIMIMSKQNNLAWILYWEQMIGFCN
jgi:hypothetical protein